MSTTRFLVLRQHFRRGWYFQRRLPRLLRRSGDAPPDARGGSLQWIVRDGEPFRIVVLLIGTARARIPRRQEW